jgi:CHAT domain-containing protein
MQAVATILRLLLREEWRGGPDALRSEQGGLPAAETILVQAAAALGAGEPKRAVRLLDATPPPSGDAAQDLAAVGRVLRVVADMLEWNWFPGGTAAVADPGDPARSDIALLAPASPDAAVLVTVGGQLVRLLPTLRTTALGTRRESAVLSADAVTGIVTRLVQEVSATPAAAAPALLAVADLEARAGLPARAGGSLDQAVQIYRALDDQTGVGACALVRGDRSLEPDSHPELLGEDLDAGAALRSAGRPDPDTAAAHYREAEQAFAAAGSTRGAAAVALRQARLAGLRGDPADAIEALDRCVALAEGAGDGALARLATVHRALAAISAGHPEAATRVAEEIVGWATSVGSRSYARGLSRLCHAVGRRWRGRDAWRWRAALLLAEAIADGVGAGPEVARVRAEVAEQYSEVGFDRAALLLRLLDLAEGEHLPAARIDAGVWAQLIQGAVAAHRDAVKVRDAAALRTALDQLRRIGALQTGTALAAAVGGILAETDAEADVLIPLYEGAAARDGGDLDRADQLFDTALAAARAANSAGMLTAVVRGTSGSPEEGVPAVEALVDGGRLAPDLAASLFVRLKRGDLALPQIARAEQEGRTPAGWRPWEWDAVHAEALLGVGHSAEALARAEGGVAVLEKVVTGLSRDVLRTMALDNPTAAGLYTTAVRACARLHEASGDPDSPYLARAFRLSERCRGVLLAELVDLDRTAGAVGAVRAWLAAGAELARTVEHLDARMQAGSMDRPADLRRRMSAAELAVDDAEAEVMRVAPALLPGRDLPATPPLAAIQDRLTPGTLLLEYHAFDDEVIGWAVDRGHVRMERIPIRTALLGAHVRRFVRALADPTSDPAEWAAAAEPLRDLLDRFAAEIDRHDRVVVVPHGPLAGLPFHALPFGDDDLSGRPGTKSISYLPAASTAPPPGAPPRETGPGAPVLVVGNPAYDAPRGLRSLPGAAIEAEAIGALRGTTALVGEQADRTSVRQGLRTARIAHLATHGLLHEQAPYSAELPLAGNGSLTVPDLMGVDTTLDLAVLSACDSGRGRSTAAGDLIGLTRALMAAGTRELVVSLWPVDDQLACLTMVRFHRALLGDAKSPGLRPADALAVATAGVRDLSRESADAEYDALRADVDGGAPGGPRSARDMGPMPIEHRRTQPRHPYFWAPFVHVGLPSEQQVAPR